MSKKKKSSLPFDPLNMSVAELHQQVKTNAHKLKWSLGINHRLRRPLSVEDLIDDDDIVMDEFGVKISLPDNRNRFPEYTRAEWTEIL